MILYGVFLFPVHSIIKMYQQCKDVPNDQSRVKHLGAGVAAWQSTCPTHTRPWVRPSAGGTAHGLTQAGAPCLFPQLP